MSLSSKVRRVLEVCMANKSAAKELADAVDVGGNPVAASVSALGATTNLSALVVAPVTFAAQSNVYAVPAEPTGSEVDDSIDAALALVKTELDLKADNADVETLRGQVEARLDAVEAKVDAVIAALKAAGLMSV